MAVNRKSGLGKGLDVLFVDNDAEASGSVMLKIGEIEPNRLQPRREFEQEALSELADSIREHGVLSPLLVRPLRGGGYQIVAGERRWRASRLAGLSEVPVIIREMSDSEAMELALIENLQRENLNAVEEAAGYKQLMERHGMTQEKVAQRIGKSRSVIANAIRILSLPEEVLDRVREGKISSGHARALLAIEDEKLLLETAKAVLENGITVRQVENIAKEAKSGGGKTEPQKPSWGKVESFYRQMELALSETMGGGVKIKAQGERGTLEISFSSKEELSRIAELLSR